MWCSWAFVYAAFQIIINWSLVVTWNILSQNWHQLPVILCKHLDTSFALLVDDNLSTVWTTHRWSSYPMGEWRTSSLSPKSRGTQIKQRQWVQNNPTPPIFSRYQVPEKSIPFKHLSTYQGDLDMVSEPKNPTKITWQMLGSWLTSTSYFEEPQACEQL